MPKTDPDRYCTQHHGPRSECRPSDRHVRTIRFRDDDWEAAEDGARAVKSDSVSTLAVLAVTVMTAECIRCYRCRGNEPPVPVVMGDLTGTTLCEALLEAEERVAAQHPAHEPVRVGAGPGAPMPPLPAAVKFVEPAVTR